MNIKENCFYKGKGQHNISNSSTYSLPPPQKQKEEKMNTLLYEHSNQNTNKKFQTETETACTQNVGKTGQTKVTSKGTIHWSQTNKAMIIYQPKKKASIYSILTTN